MAQQPHDKRVTPGSPGEQPKPAGLPEIQWLPVTELLIDYTYQHRSYEWAVEEILADFRPELSGLILVNIRPDGKIFILDGATRWAVRARRQDRWILAEVMRGMTPQQEAAAYLVKAQNKPRQPIDWFVAEVAAGRPQAKLINEILNQRDIFMQSFATRTGMVQGSAVVSCVRALKRIVPLDSDGSSLRSTLDLILDTWGYERRALAGEFLQCIAGLLAKHEGNLVRNRFIEKFREADIGELWEEARKVRTAAIPRISLRRALHIRLVDLYNVGAKRRLAE
jgi:hypothetical protein